MTLIVKRAVQEAARFYAKLYKMGFAIEYMDVGGGLGVDYDGSRSAFDSSTNYTLQEYANDIVYYIGDVCATEKVPHPDIISESGRALVAHHSVLVVEVFGGIAKVPTGQSFVFDENEHALVKELLDIQKNLPKLNKLEASQPLPPFYWTGVTDLNCLRRVIGQTLEFGYAHHIQRLMVTGLFSLLLGVKPQAVHEWYLAMYVDAAEWVELPNTLGMSQFAITP